jgi:hypothetical protein
MAFMAKPAFALAFGAFFLCAVTCAHFDQLATYPLGVVPDWAAGDCHGFVSRRSLRADCFAARSGTPRE